MDIKKLSNCATSIIKFKHISDFGAEDLKFDTFVFDLAQICTEDAILDGNRISEALLEVERFDKSIKFKVLKQ